jgi:uncharacterized protein
MAALGQTGVLDNLFGETALRSNLITRIGILLLVWSAAVVFVELARAADPSFDCAKADGSIETMICADGELAALDRELAAVYAAAARKAVDEHPPVLKAEQRGWIKGRNACWKGDDPRSCVEDAYRLRIAELQARYRLVPEKGPFRYACDGNPRNGVMVTFFETDPPTLIAERGDQVSFMVLQPSASGTRYQGRNELFWEHQGGATVVWGHQAPEMRCLPKPR